MLSPRLRVSMSFPDYDRIASEPELFLSRLTDMVQAAERSGFDAFLVMDHFQHTGEPGLEGHGLLDGPTVLGALGARTERIHLGLLTAGVTYRNPAMLVKMTTTLDVLTGGRALLGIGAGYLEHEHVAYGWDFPSTRERFERLEDALRIARAMFAQDESTVAGTHHRVEGALNRPHPIRGDIPILIGGNGRRKTLKFVAQYGDICNVFGGSDEVRELMDVIERHCEDVSRDPSEIWRTNLEQVLIANTSEEAHRKLAHYRKISPSPEQFDSAFVGDVDEVSEQVAARCEAGIDGIVAGIPDAHDVETIELVGQALSRGTA